MCNTQQACRCSCVYSTLLCLARSLSVNVTAMQLRHNWHLALKGTHVSQRRCRFTAVGSGLVPIASNWSRAPCLYQTVWPSCPYCPDPRATPSGPLRHSPTRLRPIWPSAYLPALAPTPEGVRLAGQPRRWLPIVKLQSWLRLMLLEVRLHFVRAAPAASPAKRSPAAIRTSSASAGAAAGRRAGWPVCGGSAAPCDEAAHC